jgi:hypothetical protein
MEEFETSVAMPGTSSMVCVATRLFRSRIFPAASSFVD